MSLVTRQPGPLTAAQVAACAPMYRAISAQAAAIHDMFINTLATSAGSSTATEAADAVTAGLGL
jgi:hypothetical protein